MGQAKHFLIAIAFALLGTSGAALAQVSTMALEGPSDVGPTTQRPYSLQPLELTARFYFGRDDNVNFVSDGDPWFNGQTDSGYVGFTGIAAVHNRIGALDAGASVRLDATRYLDSQDHPDPSINDDASEYDLTALTAAAYIEKRWEREGLRRRVGASIESSYDQAEISSVGGTAHYLKLYGEYEPSFHSLAGIEATIAYRDFDVSFSENAFDRDGAYFAAKVYGRYDFDGRRRSVGGFLKVAHNAANGERFRYDGVAAGVTPQFQITAPLWLNLEASAERRNYEGAPLGAPRTKQTIVRTAAQAVYVINRHWSADLTISHIDVGADDPLYEGDRTNIQLGFQVRY